MDNYLHMSSQSSTEVSALGASQSTESDSSSSGDAYTNTSIPRKATKRKNEEVRQHFTYELDESSQRIAAMCRHCMEIVINAKVINITRLSNHITDKCQRVTDSSKRLCSQSSQEARRRKKDSSQIVLGFGGTISNEPSGAAIARSAITNMKRATTSARRGEVVQSYMSSHYQIMTQERFDDFMIREVELRLARFDPMNYFFDPLVRNNYVQTHGKMILKWYPNTQDTLFTRYVFPIDRKIMEKITAEVESMPGCASLEVDGVTCNRRSHFVYTISKGDISLFLKTTQLGDRVHETDAEANDIVETIETTEKKYKTSITNMAVDNAGVPALYLGLERFKEKHPNHAPITITRDPGHCLDLLSKDCVDLELFKNLITDIEKLTSVLTNDKIRGMMDNLYTSGIVPTALGKLKMYEPTRIGKIALYLESLLKLEHFVTSLENLNEYKRIFDGRTAATKKSWVEALKPVTNPNWWCQIKLAFEWFNAINICQNVTSRNNFPQSAYLPLVVSLKNEFDFLECGVNGRMSDAGFDVELQRDFFKCMKKRFNMDGKKPEGRCVGLLSEHQIWAFMCDPFRKRLPCHIVIQRTRGEQLTEMLTFFSNNDNNKMAALRSGFNDFTSNMGSWKDFRDDKPKLKTLFSNEDEKVAKEEQSKLRIKSVVNWVDDTDGVSGRLAWLSVAPNDLFRNTIAFPLMSARTSGSMSVERVAKPLKNNIFTVNRNRLGFYKASVLLRVGINLRYCYNANMNIRNTVDNTSTALQEMYMDYHAAKEEVDDNYCKDVKEASESNSITEKKVE